MKKIMFLLGLISVSTSYADVYLRGGDTIVLGRNKIHCEGGAGSAPGVVSKGCGCRYFKYLSNGSYGKHMLGWGLNLTTVLSNGTSNKTTLASGGEMLEQMSEGQIKAQCELAARSNAACR